MSRQEIPCWAEVSHPEASKCPFRTKNTSCSHILAQPRNNLPPQATFGVRPNYETFCPRYPQSQVTTGVRVIINSGED